MVSVDVKHHVYLPVSVTLFLLLREREEYDVIQLYFFYVSFRPTCHFIFAITARRERATRNVSRSRANCLWSMPSKKE